MDIGSINKIQNKNILVQAQECTITFIKAKCLYLFKVHYPTFVYKKRWKLPKG